jgi:hypothetical protein
MLKYSFWVRSGLSSLASFEPEFKPKAMKLKTFTNWMAAATLALAACTPVKIVTDKSTVVPAGNTVTVPYTLPKKQIRVSGKFKVTQHVEVKRVIKKNSTGAVTSNETTSTGISQELGIDEALKIDELTVQADDQLSLQYENTRKAANNLSADIELSETGVMKTFNSESVGKDAEIISKSVQVATTVVKIAATVLPLPFADLQFEKGLDFSLLEEKKVSGTTTTTYVDTVERTTYISFSKIIEPTKGGTTIIKPSEFAPGLTDLLQVKISIESGSKTVATEPTYPVQGIVYKIPQRLLTTVTISIQADDANLTLANEAIVYQEYVAYPQFGQYGVAPVIVRRSGKHTIGIEFHDNGALKKHSYKRENDAADALEKVNTALDGVQKEIDELHQTEQEKLTHEKEILQLKKEVEELKKNTDN